jgi:hypothetical protein
MMTKRSFWRRASCSAGLAYSIVVGLSGTAAAQLAARAPDFNGDTRPDFAVSAPYQRQTAGGAPVGMVMVFAGNAAGGQDVLQTLFEGPLPAGVGTEHGQFGAALAWGKFDWDDYTDLAIAAPYKSVNGVVEAGVVYVYSGSAEGLKESSRLVIHRARGSVLGDPSADANFGHTLTTGDYNRDGYDDLAVTVPGASYSHGEVQIFNGSFDGLTFAGDQILGPSRFVGQNVEPENPNQFGYSTTSGDFDCDGTEDFAISNATTVGQLGFWTSFTILYGPFSSQRRQDSLVWTVEEAFWAKLTAGNFNNDSRNGRPCIDIAVGMPGSYAGDDQLFAGSIEVWGRGSNGSFGRLSRFSQDGAIVGVPEVGDNFGMGIAMGSLNGDGFDDLIVGASGENAYRGGFHLLKGSGAGLTTADNIWLHQDAAGIPGVSEDGDYYGYTLGSTGNRTLIAAAVTESIGAAEQAGFITHMRFKSDAVFILDGPATGVDASAGSFVDPGAVFGLVMTQMRPGFVR